MKQLVYIMAAALLTINNPALAATQSSASYSMTAEVTASGGGAAASANYVNRSALGQSTPIGKSSSLLITIADTTSLLVVDLGGSGVSKTLTLMMPAAPTDGTVLNIVICRSTGTITIVYASGVVFDVPPAADKRIQFIYLNAVAGWVRMMSS